MWPSFERKRDFYISALRASFAHIFVLSAPKKGIAPMVPTLSPTAVVAEPTYAKLRQTEIPELREARGFLLNPRGPPSIPPSFILNLHGPPQIPPSFKPGFVP